MSLKYETYHELTRCVEGSDETSFLVTLTCELCMTVWIADCCQMFDSHGSSVVIATEVSLFSKIAVFALRPADWRLHGRHVNDQTKLPRWHAMMHVAAPRCSYKHWQKNDKFMSMICPHFIKAIFSEQRKYGISNNSIALFSNWDASLSNILDL